VFNLALLTAGAILPLVAPAALGLEASGWFYIAFTVASLAWAVPESLSVALYATGRNDPGAFAGQLRFAATLSLGLGIVGSLLTLVLAEPVLLVFGPEYAAEGADTLRILVLGIFPATLLSLYAALARMQRSQLRGTLLTIAGIAVGLGAALVGARLAGMTGYAAGWVLGTTLMRLPMALSIWRGMR
jgi:O-antigen/teichoic acid export membrane protein